MSDDERELFEGSGPKKRRARHRGSVEVLKSGAVRVRIRDVVLPDGRRVDLPRTITADFGRTIADRVKEARSRVLPALVKRAMDLESGLAAYDAEITLAECVARLRANRAQLFKWNSRDASGWKRCRPLWNLPLANIDVPRVRSMIERWSAEGHSAAYVRSMAGLIRRVLGRAAENGWIARVPVWPRGLLPSATLTKRGMSAKLDADGKAALFAAAEARDKAKGSDLANRLAFQLDNGLRPIECAWARAEDLREEETDAGPAWFFYPDRAKGSGLREGEGLDRLPVSASLALRVLRYLDGLPARAQATGLLFPYQRRGGTWTARFVESATERRADMWITEAEVIDLRARSGLTDWHPYMLRHTRANDLLHAGATAAELQRFGAWRDPKVVQGYAGMVRELPAAVLTPSAPEPAKPKPLRLVKAAPSGFTPEVNLRESHGRDSDAANDVPKRHEVNPVGAPVGAGGRGLAVGREGAPTPLSDVTAWLDEAAEWKSARACVGVWARKLGLPEIRRRAEVAASVEVVGREGALKALSLALAARVAERGPKKAPETETFSNNLKVAGAPRDYCPKEIHPADSADQNAPGNKRDS